MMKPNRGFTLIELLVVIAIIGILSSVVLASLNSAREKSRDARRISDIKQLQLALELYFDDNSAYPSATTSGLAPTYIPAVPVDPLGDPYPYANATTGTDGYCVGANLEDTTHNALQTDADETQCDNFDGEDDSDGCGGETNVACYDIRD